MTPTKIILHCSDSPNGKEYDIEKIRAFHTSPPPQGRGWSDVGYHAVIQPSGEVQFGRGFNIVGAHCEGENSASIGICLVGSDRFTNAAFDSLRRLLDSLTLTYPIKKWELYCHHQFPSAVKQGKTCPNIPVNNLLAWYLVNDYKAISAFIHRDPKLLVT